MKCTGEIFLKKKEEKRILSGHLWVFSNEIDRINGTPENGDIVMVRTGGNAILGVGFYNKNSLISVRMLSREPQEDLYAMLTRKIRAANKFREEVGCSTTYRMVFGESDFIPGLVIDRYDDVLVIESYCAGVDNLIPIISEILVGEYSPAGIIEKSASVWREHEGLESRIRILSGSAEEFIANSGDMSYKINMLESQKTGLFLDQLENRLEVERLSHGKNVLDCFCNVGGFALHAARGGASSVLGIDISSSAVERAQANSRINNLDNVTFRKEDVFSFLDAARKAERKYDLIILDPPSFVKSRKKLASGVKGYQKINEQALQILKNGGMLVTCSCSHHVTEEIFLNMLHAASAKQKKQLQIFKVAGAGKDHPVLLSMPETRYLTCVFSIAEDA